MESPGPTGAVGATAGATTGKSNKPSDRPPSRSAFLKRTFLQMKTSSLSRIGGSPEGSHTTRAAKLRSSGDLTRDRETEASSSGPDAASRSSFLLRRRSRSRAQHRRLPGQQQETQPGTIEAEKFQRLRQCYPELRDNPNRVIEVSYTEPRVKNSAITPGELLFEPSPQVVFFVDFEPFKEYDCLLRLRNRDSIARRIQVTQPDIREFTVLPGREGTGPAAPKVAPGMTTFFTIRFSPQARQNYSSEAVVITEREKFVVPLRAISGMGFIEAPSRIEFDVTPVKVKTEKTVLLRNTGTQAVDFTVTTEAPFSSSCKRCFLDVGDSTQASFLFEPVRVNTYSSVATMRTTEGLEFFINLFGLAENADVRLSTTTLKMDNTSVELVSEKTLYIHNKSEHHLDFAWQFVDTEAAAPGAASESGGLGSNKATASRESIILNADAFTFIPPKGRVWANTSFPVTVTFCPTVATRYARTASCLIAGREEGLIVSLQGLGIGPKVKFLEYDSDFGETVIHTQKRTEIELSNQGNIEACFSLTRSQSPVQSQFVFTPESGRVVAGATAKIVVSFLPTSLGAFHETFEWHIEDLPQPVTISFKGEVVPPAMIFDVEAVDFGRVSFGFEETRSLAIRNMSTAPQPFSLRIEPLKNGDVGEDDLSISPASGSIAPRSVQHVTLKLLPKNSASYNLKLLFDLGDLFPALYTIPLKAVCELPTVNFEPDDLLQFDEVFVGHLYTKTIFIHNPSALAARYEVAVEEAAARATVSVDDCSGVIEPMETRSVTVSLKAHKLGPVAATLQMIVLGFPEPTWLRVRAMACGPRIKTEPREVDWGKIACLLETPKFIKVTNVCPIPAEVKCTLKNRDSYFKLRQRSLTLAPGSCEMLEVVAAFNEPTEVQDLLMISVTEGSELGLTLRGQGTQFPLVISRDISVVDFGMLYTTRPTSMHFTIENRGRRSRKLSWQDGCKSEKQITHQKEIPFTIVPDSVILEPGAMATFEYKALSSSPGRMAHALICMELAGFGTKALTVTRTLAKAEFFVPTISFCPPSVYFRYVWKEGDTGDRMSQNVVVSNDCQLPVACILKPSGPFSISPSKLKLKPKGNQTLTVSFNPNFNGRLCSKVKERLEITYEDHSKTDAVELRADVTYPAVEIDRTVIDFGCIFNETTKRLPVVLKNPTELPVVYHWYLSDQQEFMYVSGDDEFPLALLGRSSPPPINKIFDFLPFTGTIEPGGTETICASFFGLSDLRVSTTALCVIDNGPEFSVKLKGQASMPTFRLSQTEFDFGEVCYNKMVEAELGLINTGLVDVSFSLDLSKLDFPWILDVSKKTGHVPSRDKQKIGLRFRPGLPMEFRQTVYVEIGHFEPMPIVIRGVGTFPSLVLSLPRRDEAFYQEQRKLMIEKLKKQAETATAETEEETAGRRGGLRRELSLEEKAEKEVDLLNVCDYLNTQYVNIFTSSQSGGGGYEKLRLKPQEDGGTGGDLLLPERQGSTSSSVSSSSSGYSFGSRIRSVLEGVRVTAAQYAHDFGYIVVGQSRKKALKVVNRSTTSNATGGCVSFKANKRVLSSSGFSIEPETVSRLGPGEEATLTVSISREKEGTVGSILQLQTAEGPLYTVHLKATFVIPDLSLSVDKIDFGVIKRGQRKTVFVRFKNTVPVPVEWRLRDNPLTKSKKRSAGSLHSIHKNFSVEPRQASLAPGEFLDVKIHFIADVNDEKEISTKLFFQVEDNPKWKVLPVKGRGLLPSLRIEPADAILDFDNCLPQQPVKREIVLYNDGSTPCEVFSVDYDGRAKLYDLLLREYPDYDEQGLAFLPIRKPGRPFWKRVVKRVQQARQDALRLQEEQAMKTTECTDTRDTSTGGKEKEEAEGGPAGEIETSQTSHPTSAGAVRPAAPSSSSPSPPQPSQLSLARQENESASLPSSSSSPSSLLPPPVPIPDLDWSDSEGEDEEDEKSYPYRVPTSKRINAILIGPTASGKTSIAEKLAVKTKRKLLTIDECLDWAASEQTLMKSRRLKNDEEFSSLSKKLKFLVDANREAAELELLANKKGGHKAKKTEKKPLPTSTATGGTPSGGGGGGAPEYSLGGGSTNTPIPSEFLISAIQYRCSMPDCFGGVIFDGLTSILAGGDHEYLATCLASALGKEQLRILSIKFGSPSHPPLGHSSSPPSHHHPSSSPSSASSSSSSSSSAVSSSSLTSLDISPTKLEDNQTLNLHIPEGVQYYRYLLEVLQQQEKSLMDQWEAHVAEGNVKGADLSRKTPQLPPFSNRQKALPVNTPTNSENLDGLGGASNMQGGNPKEMKQLQLEQEIENLRIQVLSLQQLRQRLETSLASNRLSTQYVTDQVNTCLSIEKALLSKACNLYSRASFLSPSPGGNGLTGGGGVGGDLLSSASHTNRRRSTYAMGENLRWDVKSVRSSGERGGEGGGGKRNSLDLIGGGGGMLISSPRHGETSSSSDSLNLSSITSFDVYTSHSKTIDDLYEMASRFLPLPEIPKEPPIPEPFVLEVVKRPPGGGGGGGSGSSSSSFSSQKKKASNNNWSNFAIFSPLVLLNGEDALNSGGGGGGQGATVGGGGGQGGGQGGGGNSTTLSLTGGLDDDKNKGIRRLRDPTASAGNSGPNKGKGKVENKIDEETAAQKLEQEPGYLRTTRWTIPPQGQQSLLIKFCVDHKKSGVFDADLSLQIVGDSHPFTIEARAVCGLPKISMNPRHLFKDVVRQRPCQHTHNSNSNSGSFIDAGGGSGGGLGMVRKQFILNEGVFDFGPLLCGRPSAAARGLYAKSSQALFESSEENSQLLGICIPDELVKYHEVLTLRNDSPFPTIVRCALQGNNGGGQGGVGGIPGAFNSPPDTAEHSSRKKGGGSGLGNLSKTLMGAAAPESAFFVHPVEISLDSYASRSIHLWCFPRVEGEVKDLLTISMKDNPDPLEIPLISHGALPRVQMSSDHIQFARVLVGQTVIRTITLKNVSPIAAKWNLLNVDTLQAKMLKIGPELEGILQPFSTTEIQVAFTPTQKTPPLQAKLSVRFSDAEGMAIGQENKTISIDGEVYSIDLVSEYGTKGKGILDFGNVQVGQSAELPITLFNKGKFSIRYSFRVKSKAVKSILTFLGPDEKELKAGEHRKLSVRCKPQKEIELTEAEEIFLDLEDAETGTKYEPSLPPIPITLFADFNYVSLAPARGINLGPVESGKNHSMQFEIRNEGRFAFDWCLQDAEHLGSPLCIETGNSAPANSTKGGGNTGDPSSSANKGGKAGGGAPGGSGGTAGGKAPPKSKAQGQQQQTRGGQSSNAAQFGPFRLSPVKGQLEPGAKMTIETQYTAQGDVNHSLKLALLVQGVKVERGEEVVISTLGPSLSGSATGGSGLVPSESEATNSGEVSGTTAAAAGGGEHAVDGPFSIIPAADYILQAQSCVPSITTDPDWVFEEQFVVSNSEEAAAWVGMRDARMYLVEEKCLCFGSVIANGNMSKTGLQERIRIGNPKSVAAEVTMELKLNRDTSDMKLAAATTDLESVFEVTPKHLTLGPHENKHVTLIFRPQAIQRYSASFRAIVDRAGPDATFRGLSFDLRGEGTLPTISLEIMNGGLASLPHPRGAGQPPSSTQATPAASGAAATGGNQSYVPLITMGRIAVGASATATIRLRNTGIIPATARCETGPSDCVLLDVPSSVSLAAGESKSFTVKLTPLAPEEVDYSFRLYTLSNPYEDVTCHVRGTCYVEECCWTSLPATHSTASPRGSGSELSIPLQDTALVPIQSPPLAPSSYCRDGVIHFGDVPLNETAAREVALENKTDQLMRFEVANPLPAEIRSSIQISPTSGQIAPRGRQEIHVEFSSKEPTSVDKVLVPCRVYRLKPVDPAAAKVPPKQLKLKGKPSSASGGDGDRLEEVGGVLYQVESGKETDMPLTVSAFSDTRQCELEMKDIEFESTTLFHSRRFVFRLNNPSKVSLPFEFHWEDEDKLLDDPSFYILSPKKGVVPPSSKADITVDFAPTELVNFKRDLVCSFPTLPLGGTERRSMAVNASAIRPVCHFDIPSSDYRERRAQTNLSVLDPKIKILEISSVGIGVKNTKRFFVFNPTAGDIEFEWDRVTPSEPLKLPSGGSAQSPNTASGLYDAFRCVNKRGRITAGRRTEIAVEFLPARPGIHESYWKFSIASKKLEQQFLFVGVVKEPHVALDRSSVSFNPVLLGGKAEEVVNIHNREDIPLSFVFERKKQEADRGMVVPTALTISPANGVLPPNSVTPIRLAFKPVDERPFNLNMLCRVKQKCRQLSLNVKGEGYSMRHGMVVLNEDGSVRQLPPGASQNASLLDFGSLLVGQTRSYTLQLQNGGTFDFSFHWSVQSVNSFSFTPSISINPREGVVEKGQNMEMVLTYAPTESSKHEEITLLCNVSGGEPYRIRATGSCSTPKVTFSFTTYDFGCFVLPPPLPAAKELAGACLTNVSVTDRVELRITNQDPLHDCFISTSFEKTPVLDVQLVPCSIAPGEKLSVPIVFSPRQCKAYKIKIPFSINERATAHVTVVGKGIPARLEMTNLESDEVRFAPLIKGESAVKHVKIVNRSEATLDFYMRDQSKLSSHGVTWKPLSSELKLHSLHPRQELPLEIFFKPAFSIPEFSLPLHADCIVKRKNATYRFPVHLCNVAAKSFETEVRLSQPSVSFGAIVVNSWATQTVKLTNIGELFMKYKFKPSTKYSKVVSVSPCEGLLHPHADVPIEVTFRPTEISEKDLVVDDISCHIESASQSTSLEISALQLTVVGRGVAQSMESMQTLKFSTPVRTQVTKTFQIRNPKKTDWSITPLITCELPKDAMYFFCSPSGRITIPGGQKLSIQVTYKPLSLTRQEDEKRPETEKETKHGGLAPYHAASIFVPLPDGEAMSCRFLGYAMEPTVEQILEATVSCKQQQLHMIKIKNWLPVKQRFEVSYSITQSTGDKLPQIQAPDRFDLPPSQARDYRFFASAFKACSVVILFRFTNKEKPDFYLAEARLTFKDPETLGTISLDTTVRQLASHKLTLENPFSTPVTFQCQSSIPEIFFSPCPFELLPHASGEVEVAIRPTVAGGGEGSITLVSDELGTYRYAVKYNVAPADIEKVVGFKAPLGKEVSQAVRFLHFAKKPSTTYQASIELPPDSGKGVSGLKPSAILDNFSLESKSVNVGSDLDNKGIEFQVNVKFTPSRLAESKATLVLKSPEGYEYKALLVGRAEAPQAQGPFRLGKGKSINIDFKNPFDVPTEFTFQADHPCFVVEKKSLKLEPKKSTTVVVQVKPDTHDSGRLMVTADGTPPWIFYLRAD